MLRKRCQVKFEKSMGRRSPYLSTLLMHLSLLILFAVIFYNEWFTHLVGYFFKLNYPLSNTISASKYHLLTDKFYTTSNIVVCDKRVCIDLIIVYHS